MFLQMALFCSYTCLSSIPLYVFHIFLICSYVSGHLCCLHILAIINSAPRNIRIHVSFRIIILSGYVPRSKIDGSYSNSTFSFLRNLDTAFWVFLVAQTVKNPPAVWETWDWSLVWEDSLEEGMETYSSILAWRTPMDRGAWWAAVHGFQRVRHNWVTKHSTAHTALYSGYTSITFPPTV